MSQEEVVRLMESSTSEAEWNRNCDKVRAACGGDYPGFWYGAVVVSGVMGRTAARWAAFAAQGGDQP